MDISVVIPVYGCPAALPELHRRLKETLEGMKLSYEIILVDDCDGKGSWEEIEKLCIKDDNVVGVQLSRNFGQIRAITAGLDRSRGDYTVVMDCDLQDRPEYIPDLYNKALEGYDVVFSRRKKRKDSAITKFLSKSFYKVYDYFTDGNFDSSINNFSIISRKVADAYCSMREQNRAYTMFVKWLGFKQTAIDLVGDERFEGKSSYNLRKKLKMAFEIITSQSNKPLFFSIALGFVIAFFAFLFLLVLLIVKLCGVDFSAGWPSLIGSVFLMGGLILAAIGVVGVYVGNIFNETKSRPIYIVAQTRNLKEKEDEK